MKLTRNIIIEKKQPTIQRKVLELLGEKFKTGTIHQGATIIDSAIEITEESFKVTGTAIKNGETMQLHTEIDASDAGIEMFLINELRKTPAE